MITSHTDFLNIAFKTYDNPKIIALSEFEADIKRFGHLNTIISRYTEEPDDYKLRLAVNHTVILRNCFGHKAVELILHKTSDENLESIYTVFYFLKMLETVPHLNFDLLNKLENL